MPTMSPANLARVMTHMSVVLERTTP